MEIEWSEKMRLDKVITMSFNCKHGALALFGNNIVFLDRSAKRAQVHLFTGMSCTPQVLVFIIQWDQSNLIYHGTIRLRYLQCTNVPSRNP